MNYHLRKDRYLHISRLLGVLLAFGTATALCSSEPLLAEAPPANLAQPTEFKRVPLGDLDLKSLTSSNGNIAQPVNIRCIPLSKLDLASLQNLRSEAHFSVPVQQSISKTSLGSLSTMSGLSRPQEGSMGLKLTKSLDLLNPELPAADRFASTMFEAFRKANGVEPSYQQADADQWAEKLLKVSPANKSDVSWRRTVELLSTNTSGSTSDKLLREYQLLHIYKNEMQYGDRSTVNFCYQRALSTVDRIGLLTPGTNAYAKAASTAELKIFLGKVFQATLLHLR